MSDYALRMLRGRQRMRQDNVKRLEAERERFEGFVANCNERLNYERNELAECNAAIKELEND